MDTKFRYARMRPAEVSQWIVIQNIQQYRVQRTVSELSDKNHIR